MTEPILVTIYVHSIIIYEVSQINVLMQIFRKVHWVENNAFNAYVLGITCTTICIAVCVFHTQIRINQHKYNDYRSFLMHATTISLFLNSVYILKKM